MKNKIIIINFSAAFVHEDAYERENNGISYYSTQKEALIYYLMSKFPEASIDVIGLNTKTAFKTQYYGGYKLVRFPWGASSLFSVILFNFNSFVYLLASHKPLIIFIYTGRGSYAYIGALIYAKLFRIPFFMCYRNPPESLCSFKHLPLPRRIITKILDRICWEYSAKIIHISKKSKKLLKPYPGLSQKSIVMQSCPNNIFLESNQRKKEGDNKLTFAYWGIMDKSRDLDVVITGFAKAKELDDKFDAEFYLFGGGEDLDRLKELVKKLKTPGIIFEGYVGQAELCKLLENIPVAVIPIPPKEIFQFSSPLKLAEAVTLELPMIASNIEPNQVVKKYNLGILCEHDADSYAQAFLKFWSFSDSEINEFRENCKKVKYLYIPENVFKEVKEAIEHEIQP